MTRAIPWPFALAWLVGCDPGAVAREPDAGSWLLRSPRALACTDLARATCRRLEACAPAYTKAVVGLDSLCTDQLRDDCLRRVGLGGSRRTLADVATCTASLPSMACSAFLESYPDVCPAPPGALLLEASCAFHEQCASGFCARGDDTACGACAIPPSNGSPCAGGECGRGLVCSPGRVCSKPGAVGESCSPSAPCGRLAFCDFDKCRARRALDDVCGGLGECSSFDAAYCSQSLRCTRVTTAALGAACSLTANELVLCPPPARCVDGICALPRREGELCGVGGSHVCAGYPPECVRGRCVVRTVETCGQAP